MGKDTMSCFVRFDNGKQKKHMFLFPENQIPWKVFVINVQNGVR